MDEKRLLAALSGLPVGRVAYFASIGSTNDLAAEWAAAGAPDLSVVLADEQTAGRGRAGRRWFTPKGSALAFSLTLRPENLPNCDPTLVAGLGALAAAEALQDLYGLATQIKWPNDVLLGGRKACGVLAEAHWLGSQLQALVLGIGINLARSSVPPEEFLSLPATCVEAETGYVVEPAALARAVVQSLLAWRPKLSEQEFIAAWEERLAYRGERVTLSAGPETLTGCLLGMEPDGRLRLEIASGKIRRVEAGEIRLRREVDSAGK
ncbi:MAG: biotin--[acetyl-CoA-carboxylase] ligase [Chloroflexi bacterium]|nr:biotin--[acetyl-CoA-carboxylase] ligase [Chloroflexota bacterium]